MKYERAKALKNLFDTLKVVEGNMYIAIKEVGLTQEFLVGMARSYVENARKQEMILIMAQEANEKAQKEANAELLVA